MLVYLDIICPKMGIKNLFKAIFYRKNPLVFQKAIEDISYLEIYFPKARKSKLKKMFCSTVDRRASIVPSKNFPTELFEGENFINEACEIKARLLLNFLKQVLKKVQNKRKINILLIDKEAKAVAAAAELISLCNVFVATDRFELYGPCAEYCFLKYGDRPKKADKLSSISVAFAPFGTNGLILPNSATPVLSPKSFEGFTLSEKDFCFFHTDLFPEKVSKELFLEGIFKNFCPLEILQKCPESLAFQGISVNVDSFFENFLT